MYDPSTVTCSSNATFVAQVENFEGTVRAKPLGKSDLKPHILRFVEYVAAREMLGHDWNAKEDGDVFYDPIINDREPTKKYLRWMTQEEIDELNSENNSGALCETGILHVSDNSKLVSGCRKICKRYTIYKVEPTIWDLMNAETPHEELFRQITAGNPLLQIEAGDSTQEHACGDADGAAAGTYAMDPEATVYFPPAIGSAASAQHPAPQPPK